MFREPLVAGLLEQSFQFWQRDDHCLEGRQFMGLYKILPDSLPVVCVVDPRTGRCVRQIRGEIFLQSAVEQLSQFLTYEEEKKPEIPKLDEKEERVRYEETVEEVRRRVLETMPKEGESVVSVTLKLPDGRTYRIRLQKRDRVERAFDLAAALVLEDAEKIDLTTTYPRISLRSKRDAFVEEVGVAGSVIVVSVL